MLSYCHIVITFIVRVLELTGLKMATDLLLRVKIENDRSSSTGQTQRPCGQHMSTRRNTQCIKICQSAAANFLIPMNCAIHLAIRVMTCRCSTPDQCSLGACAHLVRASCPPLRNSNLNTIGGRSILHLCCPTDSGPPCASIWCRGTWCTDCNTSANSTLHLCFLAICKCLCPPSCTTVCPCPCDCGLCRTQNRRKKSFRSTAQKCCLARYHRCLWASTVLPGHTSQASKSACHSIPHQTSLFGLYLS